MIAKRNLPPAIVSEGSEQLIHKMLKLTHVRLDRENIGEIDHMEVLGPVTNLYLQQNFIEKIENLESLMEIRFLVLSGNKIKVVENIELLDKLQFLDLADNLIENLDPEQFPKSLMILNLTGNPCFAKNGYRLEVIKSLPRLKQLDGEMVTDKERREAGHEIVSESDEDSDDDEGLGDDVDKTDSESYHKSLDDVLRLSADLISKSKNRTLQYLSSHDGKMAAIEEIRSQSRQEMTSARSEVTPR
ncbi:hypothetical protein BSL78_06410 [Apostichopus japonicus]|uniref:U2A'/phosphoprotein 32 family A C-terminal domain-containing protein n=1 Tax=Stichopus japonicus TaxID=307972 RepID=A0A2G8L8U7_STIJA|nr:hypothetical protein BSL78_06410 [Apostichopus japonicus]